MWKLKSYLKYLFSLHKSTKRMIFSIKNIFAKQFVEEIESQKFELFKISWKKVLFLVLNYFIQKVPKLLGIQ